MLDIAKGQAVADLRDKIVSDDLAEVILLLDHLSGLADRSISDLVLDAQHPDLVRAVFESNWPPTPGQSQISIAETSTILFKARDRLNELAWPATGASIAFTILVTDEEAITFEPDQAPHGPQRRPSNRKGMAAIAYPRYVAPAAAFRDFRGRVFLWLATALAVTIVLSWHVAAGQFFLQTIAQTDAKRAALLPEIYTAQLREHPAPAAAGAADKGARAQAQAQALTPYCPVSASNPAAIDPVQQTRLCTQLLALQTARCAAADSLFEWHRGWEILTFFLADLPDDAVSGGAGRLRQCLAQDPLAPTVDPVEQVSAGIVQVFGSGVLPMLYGLLGAFAAIGLAIHRKTKDSLLMPRDYPQMRLQMVLGVVVGGCIGLFLTPSAAVSLAGAAGSDVTLSFSGLSFLAGFGVEQVFKWLERLVLTAFGGAAPTPPARRTTTQTVTTVVQPPPSAAPKGPPPPPPGGGGAGGGGAGGGAPAALQPAGRAGAPIAEDMPAPPTAGRAG
jgi:hypothetical protein